MTVTPAEAWGFRPDPAVLAVLGGAGIAYADGVRRAWRRAGRGRVIPAIAVVSFATGLMALALALASPIEPAAEALLSVHMAQHLLIGLIAPLLLVLGAPLTVGGWLLEERHRRQVHARLMTVRRKVRISRAATRVALSALALHTAAFWAWHAPPLYDAAAHSTGLHVAEHVSLLATGLLFWWAVVGTRWRERSAMAIGYLFLGALQGGALAALLTLAPRALYGAHLATTEPWHLTPLEDQQLAGAIMWVPGGLGYLVPAVVLFTRWLRAGPRRTPELPRRTVVTGDR